MAMELLPDEFWNEVELLIPPHPPQPKGGRPPVDDRVCLRGLIFILRSGMAYSLLPTDVFGVSGVTCWRRLRDWTRAGVWPELHRRFLNRLGKRGEIDMSKAVIDSQAVRAVFGGAHTGPNPVDRGKNGTKRQVLSDAQGLPLLVHTTPAQVRDEQPLVSMVKNLPPVQGPRGRPRRKPKALYGDRGYGFPWIIAAIVAMGIVSKLAPRGSEHGSGLGKVRYVIERTMVWFGHWRRLKLCYEKTGEHWQAYHDLAASLICFRRLQTVTARL